MQFRFEFFNALNHPIMSTPDTTPNRLNLWRNRRRHRFGGQQLACGPGSIEIYLLVVSIREAPKCTRTQLGYARVSTTHQSLDQQADALTAAGVDAARIYTDKLSGTSTRQQRPGLAALLDYARQGDAIVVVGIDRLGRNAAEVMTTIRDLGERGIVLRSLREGIDTSNASGRMVAGVLAYSPNLSWSLGGNAAWQHAMPDGHAGSPSVGLRR